jgi:hypothetical protein
MTAKQTWNNVSFLQEVNKGFALVILLIEGVMEEDDSGNGLASLRRRCEENLSIESTIFFRVFNANL